MPRWLRGASELFSTEAYRQGHPVPCLSGPLAEGADLKENDLEKTRELYFSTVTAIMKRNSYRNFYRCTQVLAEY